jgi:hypothetical protein
MMKTKILLATALFFILHSSSFISASAQRIRGFVSSGATLSQIEGDELKGFHKWGYTGGVGAMVNLDKSETWRLSIEALFTQRGSYNGTGDPYSISLRLDYVDIPLMLHWHDPWGGMLVGLGLNYSRLVQQPHNVMKFNPNYFFPDTNDMTFLNNDLMLAADIRFPVWKNLWLNIRWQYSIIAIKKDWEFTEFKGNTPLLDTDGKPVLNPDGSTVMVPRKINWTKDCYNNTLVFRLIWQF